MWGLRDLQTCVGKGLESMVGISAENFQLRLKPWHFGLVLPVHKGYKFCRVLWLQVTHRLSRWEKNKGKKN